MRRAFPVLRGGDAQFVNDRAESGLGKQFARIGRSLQIRNGIRIVLPVSQAAESIEPVQPRAVGAACRRRPGRSVER